MYNPYYTLCKQKEHSFPQALAGKRAVTSLLGYSS